MPADIDMGECTLSNVEEMKQGALVQRQIEESKYSSIRPRIMNDSVIEFEIKNPDCFLEMNKTEIAIKYHITKADGTNLTADNKVAVVNYPIAALIKSVDVKLNDKIITHGSSNYAERALLEAFTTYGRDAEKTWLRAGQFVKDTAGRMDAADPSLDDKTANHGLKTRAKESALSKVMEIRGQLHGDLFNQSRPLPRNSRIHITFTRNNDAYCLMSNVDNAAYKIEIDEMTLWVHKIFVSDEVERSLAAQQIVFPIVRVVMKEFSVTQGGNMFIENALHSGQLPTHIMLGLVSNQAHVGSYKHNPFHFTHANARKVSLFRDGQVVNGRPLEMNFENGNVMDGYWSLLRATNTRYANAGGLIELDDYKKGGYVLWAYDLSQSQCDEQYIDPKRNGGLSLEIEFAKNIAEPLTLCVFLQFDSEIIINETGAVVLMYD